MWSESNFNSGEGKMDYYTFANYADQLGLDQAVWVAKYFGVGLDVVRKLVKKYMKVR